MSFIGGDPGCPHSKLSGQIKAWIVCTLCGAEEHDSEAAVEQRRRMLTEHYEMSQQLASLGIYFREHYSREIESGLHSRFRNGVETAIFYLARERRIPGFLRRVLKLFEGEP